MGKRYDEKTMELFYEIYAEELRNSVELKKLLRDITVPNEIFSQERKPNPFFLFKSYVLGESKTYNTENLKQDLPQMQSITGRDHGRLNLIIGGIIAVALEKATETKKLADVQKENIKKELKEHFNDDSDNSPAPQQ